MGAMIDFIHNNNAQELAALLAECPGGAKSLLHERLEYLPLYLAITLGHLDIVNVLLASGTNPEQNCREGYTPLIRAVEKQKWRIVDRLLQVGVNPASKTDNNYTALHGAVRYQKTEVVERLLNCGADPNVSTSEGLTPLYYAASTGHREIISLLVAHGARLASLDSYTGQGRDAATRSVAPRVEVAVMVSSLDPVLPLQVECRQCIRKRLLACCKQGESLISNVPKLPLPLPVQKYLCNIGSFGL